MIEFPEIEGVELYLCGGFVRDYILGVESKDLDFVVITDYKFDELVEKINTMGKVFEAKPEFFTIRCKIDGYNKVIDLVYPRREGPYSDGRHPDSVSKVDTLREDSERRDLKMNAMYMDKNGIIIDYHGGRANLENGIIEMVGDPNERIKEDFLRILRILRFALKYNYEVTNDVMHAIMRHKDGLKIISKERIEDELNKCLLYDPLRTYKFLDIFQLFYILEDKGLKFQLTSKKIKGN